MECHLCRALWVKTNEAAKMVKDSGIMAAEPAAKKALTNLGDSITYIDGTEMKNALQSFYTAIGVNLPDAAFYYAK